MEPHKSPVIPVVLLLFCALSVAQATPPARIKSAIDAHQSVALKGNVHPLAQPRYQQGTADPSLRVGYMTLQFAPTASQQAALKHLLADQQDRRSPNYHKWITPQEYASRFGLAPDDLNKVVSWLRSQGFSIAHVARAGNWIAFGGTVGQVQQVFHTRIQRYNVNGEPHIANSTDPFIPVALSGIVSSIRGLNDFHPKPLGIASILPAPLMLTSTNPDFTSGSFHYLAPDDVATIYDISALYNSSFTGTGQKLVIVGQTDIDMSDIESFRSMFNLPQIDPQVILVKGSPDPGTTADLVEADLDLEWSGAIARAAQILYVNSTDVYTSAQYAVDQDLAPVISMSYGGCEPENGASGAAYVESLAQQANAEGITWVASSGDSGAAACDPEPVTSATQGLAVNLPASVPEVTGVGGTEFDEGNGAYWGSNNNPDGGSALSYIPETGWNDSSQGFGLASSGGGVSLYFPKPSWQTGPGVPSDNARDVPDVALSASASHDGYILCTHGGCTGTQFGIVGGTSASAPVFAGIVTLLNHYLLANGIQTQPGVGNINPALYEFAQKAQSALHDVVTGSNIVPCTQGTPDCPSGAPFQFGFTSGPGYDQVTGLGSVDAYNLVTGWEGIAGIGTTASLIASPAQPNVGVSVSLSTKVAPASGGGTPTGTATFYDGGIELGTANLDASGTATYRTTLPKGAHHITADYAGDDTFAASISPAVALTVAYGSTTTLTVPAAEVHVGSSATFSAHVSSPSGTPTGTVTFYDGATPLGTVPVSNSGAASYTTGPLAVSTYNVSAVYGGDANFNPSTSPVTPVAVVDFTLTLAQSGISVAAGSSGSATLTITPQNTVNETLSFNCSGLPAETSCIFSPAKMTPNGSTVSTTLTIQTTVASAGLAHPQFGSHWTPFYALLLPGLLGMFSVTQTGKRKPRCAHCSFLLILLVASTLWMAGCAGVSSSGNPSNSAGTPVGTSTVTLTATTGGPNPLAHSAHLVLTVTP